MEDKLTKRKLMFKVFSNEKIKLLGKKKYLASGSQGDVYKYCFTKPGQKLEKCLVAKKVYTNIKESKYINDIFNKNALKYNVYIDIAVMTLTNQLVLQNICPNFVLNYSYSIKERVTGACKNDFPFKFTMYNELIDGSTFDSWVREHHSIDEFYNAYFQITVALYSLHKYFNMTHLDLHSKNILVKSVSKGGYWKYIINDTEYYVPNLGFIFYLNDFDQVWVPQVFNSWFIRQKYSKKRIHKGFDIMFLFRSTLHFSTSPKSFKADVRKLIKGLRNNTSFEEIILQIWGDRYKKQNTWKLLDTKKQLQKYNLNLKLNKDNVPNELKHVVLQ